MRVYNTGDMEENTLFGKPLLWPNEEMEDTH